VSRDKKLPPHLTIGKRWEEGIDHDPRSIEMVEFMSMLDWEECDGSLDIQMGGDGDNGESMMYLLDVYFELKDRGHKFVTR
jgi:hypothetical protein